MACELRHDERLVDAFGNEPIRALEEEWLEWAPRHRGMYARPRILVSGIRCPHELEIAPITRTRSVRIAERVENDRAVVLEKFEQHVERARVARDLEGDVELVQSLVVASQRSKTP